MARKRDWTRHARTVAQIKQLCCLGLGPGAIAPPLTRLLPRLIPGLSVTLFFTDANGELANMYDPNPAAAEAAPLYVSEFYKQRRESDVTMAIADAFRLNPICTRLGQILKVDQRTWERSDLYNVILRPMDYHDAIQLAVRDGGRPLGVVKISRGVGAPEFTARDLDLLAALEPYLAHAFSGSSSSFAAGRKRRGGGPGLDHRRSQWTRAPPLPAGAHFTDVCDARRNCAEKGSSQR